MVPKPKHSFVQLGIWTLIFKKSSLIPSWLSKSISFFQKSEEDESKTVLELATLTYLWIFLKEVYSLGPVYFVVKILLNVWVVVYNLVELHFTSSLLKSVTQSLESRELDSHAIARSLVGKLLLSVVRESVSKLGEKYRTILRERMKHHFTQKILSSFLKFDLLTLEDPEVKSKIGGYDESLTEQGLGAYEAFRSLLETTTQYFKIATEMSFMYHALSKSGLTVIVAFALIHPVSSVLIPGLYDRSFVAFCSNRHFSRMFSMHNLAFDKHYREDRLNNNLGDYIEREFKKSRQALGDTCTEHFNSQWAKSRNIISEVFGSFARDWTLPLFALRMLWNFGSVSLHDLIFEQQQAESIQASLFDIIYSAGTISGNLHTIRSLYSFAEVENRIKDGDLPYPLYSEESSHSGAEIEFRNVSFIYPGTDENALTNVSFRIKPGQLVVIVGINGSGKSSAIKLLTRLYDPSSGEILLDGRPLLSYRLDDIRRATAILRQDHPILPLSLRENVALGLPERNVDDEEIQAAIYEGDMEKIVQKLKNGLETVFDPVDTVSTNFVGETDEELKEYVVHKEVKTGLSGGETQRLSASRIFMRLQGGNIRLLVADEPTSALDPEGEYELFRKLREHSGGKTVVFVTHRFGHLTKYADLILCLKDGELVERGTHEELMTAGGEYKKLYCLQARAFVSDAESDSDSE